MSTTTGLIFLNEIELVREKLGEKGVSELKKKYGEIDFSPFKFYPEEEEARLLTIIAEMLFGEDNDEAQFQIGYLNFKNFSKHPIGRIIQTSITLFGRDIEKLLLNLESIIESYVKNFDVEVKVLGDNKAKIIMRNLVFNPNLYLGYLTAAGEVATGVNPKFSFKKIGPKDYEYLVEWTKLEQKKQQKG